MDCKDSSTYILDQPLCLYELSKDVQGDLRKVLDAQEQCRPRDCSTYKVLHQLELRLDSNRVEFCHSDQAERLNGRLYVCDLAHAFTAGDPRRRGFHGGNFTWVDVNHGVFATGTLSGITNAGTHRAPFEPSCQPCHAPGFMEGRFCGVIRRSTADPALLGCQVFGSYKLEFQGTLQDERNPVGRGVLEGLIVCECQPTEPPES